MFDTRVAALLLIAAAFLTGSIWWIVAGLVLLAIDAAL